MTDAAVTVLPLSSLLIVVLASFAALAPGVFRLKRRRYPTLVALAGCGLIIGALALAPMPSPAERVARHASEPASSAERQRQQTESRASDSRPEQRRETTASSPAWARLAVLHSNSRQPPEDTFARVERAFSRLQAHCPDSAERIGDYIVKGRDMLREKSKRTSLLELTEAVVTMLDTAA